MKIARHHQPVGRLRRENMRIAICDDDDRSRSFYSNLIQNIGAKREFTFRSRSSRRLRSILVMSSPACRPTRTAAFRWSTKSRSRTSRRRTPPLSLRWRGSRVWCRHEWPGVRDLADRDPQPGTECDPWPKLDVKSSRSAMWVILPLKKCHPIYQAFLVASRDARRKWVAFRHLLPSTRSHSAIV